MGDVDLVRALGLAGISCAFLGRPDASARFSRHVSAVLPWTGDERRAGEQVSALLAYARSLPAPPVLYPQDDAALLLASRHRDQLAGAFRLPLADAELIEQLVDKGRFQRLAERQGLPVPPARLLRARPGRPAPALEISFPVVVKPAVRTSRWRAVGKGHKALAVSGAKDWAALWPQLAQLDSEVLVQRLVAGPEAAIESYHAYIDPRGAIAGEFTGRKIRTFPADLGFSTAVEVTDLPDVAELGRGALARIGLSGVAKADFKRDERGRLQLFEINPRFNLWHHPAALAGVNLPALVHADLTGGPRPAGRRARRTVTWCIPLTDLRGALGAGMSPLSWLRWASSCQAVSGLARDDPLPFLRGTLCHAVAWRVRAAAGAGTR